MANIECQTFTAATLNGLKTAVNTFFSTHPENDWSSLIGFNYAVVAGEYTAMILFRTGD